MTQYPTRSTEKRFDYNYKGFTFYIRNDLKEFWDQVTGNQKGNRSDVGNHAFELYKAAYGEDMYKLCELLLLMKEFKKEGYYKDKI